MTNAVVVGVFLVLACAKSNEWYIVRTEILIAVYFWILFTLCIMLATVIECKISGILLPGILLLIGFSINSRGVTFADANYADENWRNCYDTSSSFVEELKSADSKHMDNVILQVPIHSVDDNWPLAAYGEKRIGYTLYKHGIINRDINVTFEQNVQINRKYGLAIQ